MRVDEGRLALLAFVCAACGIALLFLLSETSTSTSVAGVIVMDANRLVEVSGTAMNITSGKFLLCKQAVCISVKAEGIATLALVSEGKTVLVRGRVKEYMGRKYLEAEGLEVG